MPLTLEDMERIERSTWLCELASRAPEPPAWWYSARKKTHPDETGLQRDVSWRVAWALALVEHTVAELKTDGSTEEA